MRISPRIPNPDEQPSRTVSVIGIGAGNPDHLTLQAVAALRRTDVFFVIDKGATKDDLRALRQEILDRHLVPGSYRVVEAPDPERDRAAGGTTPGSAEYRAAVVEWQDRRAALYERMILEELPEGGHGAFLVWGDPALYDGTLRLLDGIASRAAERGSVPFGIESIPGISSVAALAAAHRLILNRVGRPVLITTGRRLGAGLPAGPDAPDDIVVMLDGHCTFATLPDDQVADVAIYWGAYLGTPDELLIAGPVPKVRDEIVSLRAAARERKGWIMDTYLLRRHPEER